MATRTQIKLPQYWGNLMTPYLHLSNTGMCGVSRSGNLVNLLPRSQQCRYLSISQVSTTSVQQSTRFDLSSVRTAHFIDRGPDHFYVPKSCWHQLVCIKRASNKDSPSTALSNSHTGHFGSTCGVVYTAICILLLFVTSMQPAQVPLLCRAAPKSISLSCSAPRHQRAWKGWFLRAIRSGKWSRLYGYYGMYCM